MKIEMRNPLAEIIEKIESGERELIEKINQYYLENSPVHRYIGLEIIDIKPGYVKMRFRYKKELTRIGGIIHGGVIVTSIDQAGGIAAYSVNEYLHQVTMELKVNFLKPLDKENEPYTVEAYVVRNGRRTIVTEVKVFDKKGDIAAIGLGTWFKLKNISK